MPLFKKAILVPIKLFPTQAPSSFSSATVSGVIHFVSAYAGTSLDSITSAGASRLTPDGAYLEQDGHCAIGDFQMAKDAVIPDLGIILTPLDFHRIQFTTGLFEVQHLTLMATSGLAPPMV